MVSRLYCLNNKLKTSALKETILLLTLMCVMPPVHFAPFSSCYTDWWMATVGNTAHHHDRRKENTIARSISYHFSSHFLGQRKSHSCDQIRHIMEVHVCLIPGRRTGIFETALTSATERNYFQYNTVDFQIKGRKKFWKFALFIVLLVNKVIETETSYFVIYRKNLFLTGKFKG